MATEKATIINLTIADIVEDYTAKTGKKSTGSLVIFNEVHPSGDRKDDPIMYFSKVPQSKTGWTYNVETDRVHKPVISVEEKEDRLVEKRLSMLIDAGVNFSIA